MKRLLVAAAAALSLGAMVAADTAEAGTVGARRGFRGRTTIIQQAPAFGGIDITTLALLGAVGGNATGIGGILPLLALGALQPQQTTVLRSDRRR